MSPPVIVRGLPQVRGRATWWFAVTINHLQFSSAPACTASGGCVTPLRELVLASLIFSYSIACHIASQGHKLRKMSIRMSNPRARFTSCIVYEHAIHFF